MPQPLSTFSGNHSIMINNAGDMVVNHNPGLAVLSMEALISWTRVERFLLSTYLELLGSPSDNAVTAYLAVDNRGTKTAMINAVGKKVLSAENFELLQAIMKHLKSCQKKRDRLAHWSWGYSPQLENAFLLIDPRASVTSTDAHDKSLIQVYREQDFIEMIKENDQLCGFGLSFKWILSNHAASRDGELYRELCEEPVLRDKLHRQA